jgi:Ala-tRNA(Pro) deacylase
MNPSSGAAPAAQRPPMMTRAELLGFLAAHDIEQSTLDHPPVFTVSEGAEIKARLSGAHTKNLFLKDKKGALWLVSARDHASVDLKALPALVGCARLSFGDEATLALALGVTPGSVTALALVNDPSHQVGFVLDGALWRAPMVNFHPLANTATTSIPQAGFRRFLEILGVSPRIVEFG